jgi:hypothetical protein
LVLAPFARLIFYYTSAAKIFTEIGCGTITLAVDHVRIWPDACGALQ